MKWLRAFPALVVLPMLQPRLTSIDLTGTPLASIREPFTKISGVSELPGNRAILTDPMERTVWVADFTRKSAARIGAQGRGPNEYQYPSPPVSGPAGSAWILDPTLLRVLAIGPGGTITATIGLPQSADLSMARGADARGRLYFEGSDFNPATGGFSDSLNVVRWDPSTNSVTPVVRVWGGGRVIIQRASGRASLARHITPFPHLDAWTVLPDGRVAIVRHQPYRIDIASPSGAIERGAPLTNTPISITANERRIFRERTTPSRAGASMIGGGTGPQIQASPWEDAHFPQTMPPFIGAAVHATPDGQIWIGRSFSGTDKTRRYDIFDGRGRQVGAATLRATATVVGFGARSVYVARVDPDDDLVYLEKYSR